MVEDKTNLISYRLVATLLGVMVYFRKISRFNNFSFIKFYLAAL